VSSPVVDQVRAAQTAARKNRDSDRTLLYSTLLSDFGNREIELGHALSEAEALDVIRKAIKRRRESVDAYTKAARTDLADKEAAEIRQLETHLPPAIGEDEMRAVIKAAFDGGANNLGALMGAVTPGLKAKGADGKRISEIAREVLAG